jgi:hypothetical protein
LKSFKISDLRTIGFAVETGEIGGVPPVIDAMVAEKAVLCSCAREKARGMKNDKMNTGQPCCRGRYRTRLAPRGRRNSRSRFPAPVECG